MYVNDLILTDSSSSHIVVVTSHLEQHFAIKDLGSLSYFLVIEFVSRTEGLFLSQHKYTINLLRRHHFQGSKPISTPMASKALPPSSHAVDAIEYQAIGGLQYLTLTRPDITFTVSRLAQSMGAPIDNEWTAVKRLFRYLKGTSSWTTTLTSFRYLPDAL